jgi:hypothetical protein
MIRSFRSFISILFCFMSFFIPAWSYSIAVAPAENFQEIVEIKIRDLPTHGILEQTNAGYIYLKVSDEYVHRLFPIVREPGFKMPAAIRRNSRVGAHISVFYESEGKLILPVEELGRVFFFEPKEIKVVRQRNKDYIILDVDSPELEKLRQRYGFSPLLFGHRFHITLAEKYWD